MKLALALICIGGCALYTWLIFFTSPVDQGYRAGSRSNPASRGHSAIRDDTPRRVAASLDERMDTPEEVDPAVFDGRVRSKTRRGG